MVIYNGVDLKKFNYNSSRMRMEKRKEFNVTGSQKVVGIVANLAINKDHRTFIRAASKVLKEYPDTVFFVVGGTQKRSGNHISYESVIDLRGFAQKYGCENKIVFTGQRFDVPRLLAMFDVVVLASRHGTEGFSNAILEASAAGIPVVATNVCGNSEAVLNGQTGFVIPEKDPDQMAEKILYLLRNTEDAVRLGRQGMVRINTLFSLNVMVNKNELLYDELLAKRKCLRE
jgi:glycosyltransferase involved in cell wall biosynthesis